jgi:CheY-like chemotaxis protein
MRTACAVRQHIWGNGFPAEESRNLLPNRDLAVDVLPGLWHSLSSKGAALKMRAAPFLFASGDSPGESEKMCDPPAGATILVIEDDDAARTAVAALLEPHHFEVAAAPDGMAALDLLNQGLNPSLILLDMIIVSGLDGWQFLARRQKDRSLAAVPLVVMTGLGIASEEWARSLGAVGLLRKPIDADRLLSTVRQVVQPDGVA